MIYFFWNSCKFNYFN